MASLPLSQHHITRFSHTQTTAMPPLRSPPTFRSTSAHRFSFTVTATATVPPPSRTSSSPDPDNKPVKLPTKPIPGDHGLPVIGPIKDRWDYFYNQGRDEFLKSKINKHKSTVFRTNMPPGPPIAEDPRVVALLDAKSFPVLFDTSKVEKKNLFTGTFMPDTQLTGGYRTLSYLDPSEPSHGKLKGFMFSLLRSTAHRVLPEFHASYSELLNTLESELKLNLNVKFNDHAEQAAFNFLARAWYGTNPADTEIGADGPKIIGKWVLCQLGPLLSLGLPTFIEEIALRSFRLPPALVKKDYNRLYNFFYEHSTPLLDEAAKMGISRDEACHNLFFTTCFNTFGGMKIFFPNLIKQIARAGRTLHGELAAEIRSAVRSVGSGKVTMAAMEQMPLMKSVVYEALRIEPPVTMQYGRAKRDFTVESHDAVFHVKEGEMLFGYQPFATKDPKIFERAEEFVADRFIGEEGGRLLRHVVWSNGPETEEPTLHNKQCAGKDFVVLVSRLLLVELFLRYDSFAINVGVSPLGCEVTFTSLERASY